MAVDQYKIVFAIIYNINSL